MASGIYYERGYNCDVDGITHIVGVDEVGRGPLAGPLTVCACAIARGFDIGKLSGIKDSKKLSPKKREEWFIKIAELKERGDLRFALSSVSASEIDAIGIGQALQKAVRESLEALTLSPGAVCVKLDGSLRAPKEFVDQETIIKGDEKIPLISAASIIAKVTRDRYMSHQAEIFPEYGFERHKGYGTKSHLDLIKKFGVSPIHRRSFCRRVDAVRVEE